MPSAARRARSPSDVCNRARPSSVCHAVASSESDMPSALERGSRLIGMLAVVITTALGGRALADTEPYHDPRPNAPMTMTGNKGLRKLAVRELRKHIIGRSIASPYFPIGAGEYFYPNGGYAVAGDNAQSFGKWVFDRGKVCVEIADKNQRSCRSYYVRNPLTLYMSDTRFRDSHLRVLIYLIG